MEKICALTGTPDTNYDRVISMIKKKEMYSDDIEEELAGTDPENLGRGPKTRVDEVIRKHRVKAATHRMALGKIKKNVYLHEAYPLQSMPSTKRFAPFKLPPGNNDMKEHMEEMVNQNLMEKNAPSPYTIPCFIQEKKTMEELPFSHGNL